MGNSSNELRTSLLKSSLGGIARKKQKSKGRLPQLGKGEYCELKIILQGFRESLMNFSFKRQGIRFLFTGKVSENMMCPLG
jgi:hypothetical protein